MSAFEDAGEAIRRHPKAFLVVGVLLLVSGTWLAAGAYSATEQSKITERHAGWAEHASYSYAVPVTRNSTHWPIGTVLPMGQPAYFRTVSDQIRVQYAWTAEGATITRGVAAATMVIEVTALTADGRRYWSIEHDLAEATTSDPAQGLRLSATLDLDELHNEVGIVSRELPAGDGIVNWTVRTRVVYALDADGRHEEGEVVHTLPIVAADPRYVLPGSDALQWDRPHDEQTVRTVTTIAGWPGVLGSIRALALVGIGAILLGVGGVFAGGASGAPAFEREYRKQRDWVSVAETVPTAALSGGAVVDVDTLEDLVHVAADGRTRVVLDSENRVFYALLPGVTYRYARHGTLP